MPDATPPYRQRLLKALDSCADPWAQLQSQRLLLLQIIEQERDMRMALQRGVQAYRTISEFVVPKFWYILMAGAMLFTAWGATCVFLDLPRTWLYTGMSLAAAMGLTVQVFRVRNYNVRLHDMQDQVGEIQTQAQMAVAGIKPLEDQLHAGGLWIETDSYLPYEGMLTALPTLSISRTALEVHIAQWVDAD